MYDLGVSGYLSPVLDGACGFLDELALIEDEALRSSAPHEVYFAVEKSGVFGYPSRLGIVLEYERMGIE